MNTLRQAVQEYLTMRRSLGYKLQERRYEAARLRHVHGAAPRLIHHALIGAHLGQTTIGRSAGRVGATFEPRAHVRAPSKCH